MEHAAPPRRRGASSAQDRKGAEAGVPGPLPHSLALCLPVSIFSFMSFIENVFVTFVIVNLDITCYDCGVFCSFFSRRGDIPFPKREDGTILYDDIDYKVTWAAMEKLVEKGLVRAIGLSNFNSRQIDDILSVASIKPTVLQVRFSIKGHSKYFSSF